MDSRGGVAVVNGQKQHHLALPVAGLMSLLTGEEVAASYQELDKQAKRLGCDLKAPFMSLAFMALLVIPELKIGDKGLFDGKKFQFTDLYVRTKTEID
jgi:adenine deaminase